MAGYGEGGPWNSSCTVERGRSEGKVVRNGLMWEVCLPPRAMVTSRPGLQPGAMSASMALLQLESMWMSMAPVTTEGHKDRAAQSWSRPSLAAALGRAALTS